MPPRGTTLLAVLVIALVRSSQGIEDERPLVNIPQQGQVLGEIWHTLESEVPFKAWVNIPYASPPVGQHRFKHPRPPTSWEGVRDCKKTKNTKCAQMTFRETLDGIEDCLYMNIFTPANASSSSPMPVMAWIHGGGFFAGDHTTDIYGPEHFMEHKNVVLVTFNYRVGPLGFFTLNDPSNPGNQGLRDQIFALQWIQRNIRAFGGNPDAVTIMGESAGSMSVSYLMVSPRAEGLFHSAIMLSGTFISSYTHWDKHPALYHRRFAKEFGCEQEEPHKLTECLQEVPALALPEKLQLFLHHKWTGPNVWMPYVDDWNEVDPVLPLHPVDAIKKGKYNKVPIIIGTNSDEGAFNYLGYLMGVLELSELNERWEELFPLKLWSRSLDELTEQDVALARKVKHFYFGSEDALITEENKNKLMEMMGDAMFYAGVHKLIELLQAQEDPPPIYQYMYSHIGSFSTLDAFLLNTVQYLTKIFVRWSTGYLLYDQGLGVAHADCLFCLFQPHLLPTNALITPEDKIVGARMTGLLTNFAATGDPNSSDRPFTGPSNAHWTLVRPNSHLYLNITAEENLKMEYHPDYLTRVQFWSELIEDVYALRPNFKPSSKEPLLIDEFMSGRSGHRKEEL